MRTMLESEARRLAEEKKKRTADNPGGRDRGQPRVFVVVVIPHKGRSFGAECSGKQLNEFLEQAKRVEILWQSSTLKGVGVKDFTGSAFSSRAARAARLDAEAE